MQHRGFTTRWSEARRLARVATSLPSSTRSEGAEWIRTFRNPNTLTWPQAMMSDDSEGFWQAMDAERGQLFATARNLECFTP
jgi:hypothetical protein